MDNENVEATRTDGPSRRQVLRAGAAVGAGLLWVAPVVSGIGMTAAHAATTSGGTVPPPTVPPVTVPPTTTVPTSTPTPTPTTVSPPPPPPNAVVASEPPDVLGVSYQQEPKTPEATLPFTGAAVPVTGALAVGAGLVATGVAAVAATRRRQTPAAAASTDASSDGDLPAV